MNFAPTIIVLAAGRGSRFAGPRHKLEQSFGGGSTVLGTTLAHAIESGLPVAVVTLQSLLPLVAEQIARRDTLVIPEAEAARGMGHTIAFAVAERADAAGWLILPGDMPLVRAGTMRAVAAALDGHAIAFPQFRGRRGHPVGFSSELYSELAELTGDEGARRLIARYPAQPAEVDDPGVLVDIDTVADLETLRAAAAG